MLNNIFLKYEGDDIVQFSFFFNWDPMIVFYILNSWIENKKNEVLE
jgi:hypothetical protein